MEAFLDLNSYKNEVEGFKKSHKFSVGNLTTTKKELEKVISEGRLFYTVCPHTLLIFRDELDYWQLMLLTDGQEENIDLPVGKPYSSLVSNAVRKGDAREILVKKLVSMGLHFEGNYSAYKTNVSKAYPIAKSIVDDMEGEIERKGYRLLPFEEKYLDEIHELWNKYLKRYHFPKEQWNFEFEKDFVLLLFDMNLSVPKLAAMVYLFKKDASYLGSGLAVDEDYRHDMLGIYINAIQVCRAYNAGIADTYAWKLDSNKRSIKTGEIFGTVKLPLESMQYYSEGK